MSKFLRPYAEKTPRPLKYLRIYAYDRFWNFCGFIYAEFILIEREKYGVPLGSKVCLFSDTKNNFSGTKNNISGTKNNFSPTKIIFSPTKINFSPTKNTDF